MAAAAKVALMEAQSGEERKWGAGTGGDHSPDTMSQHPNLKGLAGTLRARFIRRLSATLPLRPWLACNTSEADSDEMR